MLAVVHPTTIATATIPTTTTTTTTTTRASSRASRSKSPATIHFNVKPKQSSSHRHQPQPAPAPIKIDTPQSAPSSSTTPATTTAEITTESPEQTPVNIHVYQTTELLRLLASLLTQIASTNDALSSISGPPSPTSPALASSQHATLPHIESSLWNSLTTASRFALSTPSSTLTFHARNVPTISLESYLLRILKYCPMTNEVFLALLVYFDRMSRLSEKAVGRGFVIDSYNIHRLVIAGVTVASKFFSDVFYTNSRYAKVGGLPLVELNQLELQFLLLNDFNLVISTAEMQRYAEQLILFSQQHGHGAAPPPSPSSHHSSQSHHGSSSHKHPYSSSSRTSSSIQSTTPYNPQLNGVHPHAATAVTPSSATSTTSLSSDSSSSSSSTIQPPTSASSVSSSIAPTDHPPAPPPMASSSKERVRQPSHAEMNRMGAMDAYGGALPGAAGPSSLSCSSTGVITTSPQSNGYKPRFTKSPTRRAIRARGSGFGAVNVANVANATGTPKSRPSTSDDDDGGGGEIEEEGSDSDSDSDSSGSGSGSGGTETEAEHDQDQSYAADEDYSTEAETEGGTSTTGTSTDDEPTIRPARSVRSGGSNRSRSRSASVSSVASGVNEERIVAGAGAGDRERREDVVMGSP